MTFSSYQVCTSQKVNSNIISKYQSSFDTIPEVKQSASNLWPYHLDLNLQYFGYLQIPQAPRLAAFQVLRPAHDPAAFQAASQMPNLTTSPSSLPSSYLSFESILTVLKFKRRPGDNDSKSLSQDYIGFQTL